nr:CoA ester lyase [Nocardioides flavescens]
MPPGPAWLFVPGDRPDRWATAAARADGVVVDLENAVEPAAKPDARRALGTVLDEVPDERLVVRVNEPGSDDFAHDAAAVRDAGVTTVMVPKLRDRRTLDRVASQLPGVELVVLCETADAVLDAREIAGSPRCSALMWGGEDLAVDLGGLASHDSDGELLPASAHARTHVRYAARAARVAAVDAPVLRTDRPSWVSAEARTASSMGYHAKACIHPNQVPLVRRAFAPTPEELAWAEAVVAASEARMGATGGTEVSVFVLAGQMVDHPVVALARTLLARAHS